LHDNRDQFEPGESAHLPEHLFRGGGQQLHDQLLGRGGDGESCAVVGHGQQREHDLRRDSAHDHVQLQRFCERGHGGEPEHGAELHDNRDQFEPGESAHLPEHLFWGGGQQLHDQLRGRGGDGTPGDADGHGQQSVDDLRRGGGQHHPQLQWICEWAKLVSADNRSGLHDDGDEYQRRGIFPHHELFGRGSSELHV
jgi:hypothetical protein